MRWPDISNAPRDTVVTVGIGAISAGVGWYVGAPIYLLLGPAVGVSLIGLLGVRTAIAPWLRDACFVLLGLVVGSGFDRDALAAMIRWPLAFVAMVGLIWLIMVLSRAVLSRGFGFDRRSAVLASAPGHLSFVIALAADTRSDLARISVTQSVRLLLLTLVVPFVAMAMGVELGGNIVVPGETMAIWMVGGLVIAAVIMGQVLQRLSVPAPLLMGAMIVSALGHLTHATQGVVTGWLVIPAYVVLGALIGTRFSGITPAQLLGGLWAGLTITAIAVTASAAAAVPIALALGMPVAHVLVAFAPGGFETMIAMGVVLGVIPGFVAACHMTRLLALSVLLPLMIGRGGR